MLNSTSFSPSTLMPTPQVPHSASFSQNSLYPMDGLLKSSIILDGHLRPIPQLLGIQFQVLASAEPPHGVLAGSFYWEAHICLEETCMFPILTPKTQSIDWSQHSGSSPTKAACGPCSHLPNSPSGTRAQATTPQL